MPKRPGSAGSAPTVMCSIRMPDSPWDRVTHPFPIPDPCTAVPLRLLRSDDFAQLLRSHLVPGSNRGLFQQLWIVVAFNDDLTEHTFDILEGWLDAADHHLGSAPAGDRAHKFRAFCDGAWNRLTKIREYDTKAVLVQPASHTTAGRFALAIQAHRMACSGAATAVDHALWAALESARDRANRGPDVTKGWAVSPTFTSQLIDAVRDHRRLTTCPRSADSILWGLLR